MLLLTVVVGPDQGQVFKLPEGATHLVGRQTGSVPLNDNKASRRHAEIIASDGRVTVTDLGSSNGTFINQQKLEGAMLVQDGAKIQFGQTVCVATWVPDAPGAPAVQGMPSELVESHRETRELLVEVRDRLDQLAAAPTRPQAARDAEVEGLAVISAKLDAALEAMDRARSESPATAQQWNELCGALAALAPASDPNRLASVIRESLESAPRPADPIPALEEVARKLDAVAVAQGRRDAGDPELAHRLDGLQRAVEALKPSSTALEAKLDALASAQAQSAWPYTMIAGPMEELRQAVASLAPVADQNKVIAELREALKTAVDPTPVLTEVQRRLESLMIFTARPQTTVATTPVVDTEVHAKLDALLAAVGRVPATQGEPEWIAPLHEAIASIKPAATDQIEQRLDAIAQAVSEPTPIDLLETKLDAILQSVQAEPEHDGGSAVLESKLDAVLRAIQSAPTAVGIDAAVMERLDALVATAHTESMGSASKSRLLEQKLDDLLAIVAANLPAEAEPAAVAVDTSELDVKLDAVLQAVQALGEAMMSQEGAGRKGDGETLLLQLVERIDVLASAPRDSGDLSGLIEEVRRHSETLDERLMQHVRGSSQAAEQQMRSALGDLTEAVRAMSKRSDRAVMEQVLTELRGKDSGDSREMLREVHERVKKLPTGQASTDPQAIALAVRDAVVSGFPTIEANAIRQLAEQLRVLPDRLNNAHVLGDIFSALRTLEQNQQRQAQWMQTIAERLDAQATA